MQKKLEQVRSGLTLFQMVEAKVRAATESPDPPQSAGPPATGTVQRLLR